MRKFALLLVASFGLALATAVPAQAESVLFDPTGGGCVSVCYTIDVLDPTVGNSLSLDLNGNAEVGDTGTLLYQANLGVANLLGVQQYADGDDGANFTFTASFEEEITGVGTVGPNTVLTFGPVDGETNGVFYMYAQTDSGNNLTGEGFVGTDPILTGTLVNNADFFGSFTTNLGAQVQNLDQANDDDYPLIDSISGSGSFGALILITDWDPLYFPTLTAGTSFLFATTEQRLPYITADPSRCFSIDGVTAACTDGATLGSVGPVNGLGTNTLLQTDASFAFRVDQVSEVPEPATLTLLGLGLLGGAAARRRQLKARKQQQQ